ncbi:ATP-binding protein [Sphingomonas sp. CJ20]
MSNGEAQTAALARELAWLADVLEARFATYADGDAGAPVLRAPPELADGADRFAAVVRGAGLGAAERLVFILALAPHVAPAALDAFLLQNQATGRRFTEFGGVPGQDHAGFLPTLETALFLLGGADLAARSGALALFDPDAPLLRRGLVLLDQRHSEEPAAAAMLRPAPDPLERVLTGRDSTLSPSAHFPAERITTPLDWSDLVLDPGTATKIAEIGAWITHARTLMDDWGLGYRLKPGYRCLFHGGPGTGKTLTAALLGKHHGLPVYRVDLSRIVSKWIGETEKNLAGLFDHAQDRNWILFFDEAEALFGKRTEGSTANDRSANQQIAYLLQRLEAFPGVVILSTNLRNHMDEAFARRFQSSVFFPMPDVAARTRLWRDMFCGQRFAVAADVDFEQLAADHAMAGGAIVNVLRHACLRAVMRGDARIEIADITSGIREEFRKEGRYETQ